MCFGEDSRRFPFLFGGTFIEGTDPAAMKITMRKFPFLFGGTFIEGESERSLSSGSSQFPFLFGGTFIEGRLLRRGGHASGISLPFRRDFH